MKLWQKVILGMMLGLLLGYIMNDKSWLYSYLIAPIAPHGFNGALFLNTYLAPVGTVFINLIKMVVVPLIFFSLVLGITSMTDADAFARIGIKSVLAYLFTAAFAVCIGLAFGALFHPGAGIDSSKLDQLTGAAAAAKMQAGDFDLIKLFVDMVPSNAIEAMAEDRIMQIVVFSIFVAVAINKLGPKANAIKTLCHESAHLVFYMIQTIMKFAPYGVFASMAAVVAKQGPEIMIALAKLVVCVGCALFTQYLLFGLMIIVFARMSPMPFYKKVVETQSLAFSTSSSKATLPTAMRVVIERMGVSESTTSFVLPLGTSINMDGTAIYLGITALFFAQAFGIPLTTHDYVLLILTATLGSIGAAGIPGGSIAVMGMVFTSIHLPLHGIAWILGIDRILDMLRTTVNITGDSVITLLVDKSEGTFDKKAYYNEEL